MAHWTEPGDSFQGGAAGDIDKLQEKISTPVGKGAKWDKKTGRAKFTFGNLTVEVLPDTTGQVQEGRSAETRPKWKTSPWNAKQTKKGWKFDHPKVSVTIQTVYKPGVDPNSPSAYGRGTTEEDKEAGNTSLRFHEGCHGQDFIQYLRENPLPTFSGTPDMSGEQLMAAFKDWQNRVREYFKAMEQSSEERTDNTGVPKPSP